MHRIRITSLLAFAIALIVLPAAVAAADLSVSGTTSGTASAQVPEPGVAECTPQTAVDPEDFVCDFDVAGTFNLTGGLGTGTYDGEFRLDWSIYTSSDPCAEVVGTMTLTAAGGTVELAVANTSRVCETSDPAVHDATLNATVTGGTGAYAGATGTLTSTGTLEAQDLLGQEYTAEATMTGTITVPDPTATPTPTPTPTGTPTSPPASPAAAALPDTAASSGTTSLAALVLAAACIGSLAVLALRRRSA